MGGHHHLHRHGPALKDGQPENIRTLALEERRLLSNDFKDGKIHRGTGKMHKHRSAQPLTLTLRFTGPSLLPSATRYLGEEPQEGQEKTTASSNLITE